MEKEEIIKENQKNPKKMIKSSKDNRKVKKEQSLEDKIKELEDKITKICRYGKNQRRRYEKGKRRCF